MSNLSLSYDIYIHSEKFFSSDIPIPIGGEVICGAYVAVTAAVIAVVIAVVIAAVTAVAVLLY